MGRFVTCDDDYVWKYVFGEQNSELYKVPEELGVGEHHFVRFDEEKLINEDIREWIVVDPRTEEFEAEVLILSDVDLEYISKYIQENTKQPSNNKQEPDHFIAMFIGRTLSKKAG
ncbi:hypothetical protein OLMES_3202 [Oleiphilus messinensis]|uniref:Uncharacterized protein n=1 Tax=Oleiphilus messinensis TaxID=141451 RepID=A0A1Y0ICY5_9GAMM|nr:hypothetical protein [Oleiphilus messinensis]ARU57243.1 hypothetical protein OLMES_3202 [Oleiphilus messinensis]